jgi:hypothetical protein
VWNPVQAVHNLSEITKEICYITTPFLQQIHDFWDYLRMTDEWYQTVLPKVGFKTINVKYREATDGLQHLKNFYQSEGLRMSKNRIKNGESYKLAMIGIMVEARK